MANDASPATLLLRRLQDGDGSAANELFAVVYDELRRLAGKWNRDGSPRTPTLPPTALVHEAYVRLVQGDALRAGSRTHFFRLAARAMRMVLVDRARYRGARKRGTPATGLGTEGDPGARDPAIEVLQVDEILGQLAAADPASAEIVEMRLFGGLTNEEIAAALGISARTVERNFRSARAWMHSKLGRAPDA